MAKEAKTNDEVEVANENVEGKTSKKYTRKEPKKLIVSAAQYHDFDESPIYIGTYVSDFVAEDKKVGSPTFGKPKVMGYNFVDEDGELVIISNSQAIEKALNTKVTVVSEQDEEMEITHKEAGTLLQIEFLGKVDVGGKPFNRFKISEV